MKKAQSSTVLNWALVRIFILIFIMGTFVTILTSYYSTGLNSHDVEDLIMIKRLTYSPNLLALKSNTGRVYPGIIDFDKFNTDHLEENLVNQNKRLAVNLELTDLQTEMDFENQNYFSKDPKINPLGSIDILWIDELHFIDYDIAKKILNIAIYEMNLIVYISMIDNFINEIKVQHLDLVIPCNSLSRKNAICQVEGCKKDAIKHILKADYLITQKNKNDGNNNRNESKTPQLKVGDNDIYMVLCWSCFNKNRISIN